MPSFLAHSVQGEWHSKGIHLNPQYHGYISVNAVLYVCVRDLKSTCGDDYEDC